MRVYALNLPRSENRRETLKLQMETYGLDYYWVAGGDREEMQVLPENYDPTKAQRDMRRQMGLGEIGCLMGHLRAFQAIIDSGDEWGVILEDDVQLNMHPIEGFKEVLLEDPSARLILGSNNPHRRVIIRTIGEKIHRLERAPYSAYCYCIHRSLAAHAIVCLSQSLHMPIDVYFRHACKQNHQGFWQYEDMAQEHEIGELSVIGDEARMHDRDPSAWRRLETSNVCPQLIHQIWLGPKDVPGEIESWIRCNPGHIHRLWTSKELWPLLGEYGVQEIWTAYMSEQNYPAAADVARYCILHKFGGFYADADSECLRPFDITSPFLAWESEEHRPGLIMNGFMQMKMRHPLMLDIIRGIKSIQHPVEHHRTWQDLGPGALTAAAEKYGISILPSALFCPDHFEGPNQPTGVSPYCRHSWGSTHKKQPEEMPRWLSK